MNRRTNGIALLVFGLLLSVMCQFAAASTDLDQTDEIQWQATTADPAPADILNKADKLKTPVKIYEFLRNNAKYALYQGSRSGSVNTLDGLRGDDVDLASALIAMYRSQGIPARYAVATVRIDAARLENWLGVTNLSLAVSLLKDQGTYAALSSDSTYVDFEHVWVEVLVPYGDYRGTGNDVGSVDCGTHPSQCRWIGLDPSFKQKIYPDSPIDIYGKIAFDYTSYYAAIKDDNKALLNKNPLTIYKEQVQSYLEANDPGKTLEDVVDTGTVVPDHSGVLPASLPYSVLSPIRTYKSVDEHDAAVDSGIESVNWAKYLSGTITLNNASSGPPISISPSPIKLATLTTEPLTISYDNVAQEEIVQLGGHQIATLFAVGSGQTAQIGDRLTLTLSLDVPPTDHGGTLQVPAYSNLVVGGYYLIGTGGNVSNWSQVHRAARELLEANKQYTIVYNPDDSVSGQTCDPKTGQGCTPYIDSNGSGAWDIGDQKLIDNPTALNDLTGHLLYVAMEQYFSHFHDEIKEMDALDHVVSPIEGFVGVVSSTYGVQYVNGTAYSVLPSGLLIDMKGQYLAGMWRTNAPSTSAQADFKLLGHASSSLEHETWQELTGYDAMSTVRGIQIALAQPGAQLDDLIKNGTTDNLVGSYPDFGFQLGSPPAPFTAGNFVNDGENGVQTNPVVFSADNEGEAFDVFKKAVDSSTNALRLGEHKYVYTTANSTGYHGSALYSADMLCVHLDETTIKNLVANYASVGWDTPIQLTQDFPFCDGNVLPAGWTTPRKWYTAVENDYTNGVIPYVGPNFVHFFDKDHGFVPSDYAYRAHPPATNAVDTSVMKDIRDTLDLQNQSNGWYEVKIPTQQASSGGYKFNVYISWLHSPGAAGAVFQQSYIIRPAAGLPAGGGYVDSTIPLNPSVPKAITGSSIVTPVFDNSIFTDKQLVSSANNDLIRTPSTADPVSTVTGNNFHDEKDFTIRGRGLDYVFTRTYNSAPSATANDGPLGHGWTDSYNVYLQSNDYGDCPNCAAGNGSGQSAVNGNNATSSITFYDERGGAHNYLEDGDNGTYAVTAPTGEYSTLTLDTPVAGEYTLTFRNGTKYIFQDPTYTTSSDLKKIPGKKARLITIEDPYGNQLNLVYDATTGNLVNVKDNLGISGRDGIRFTYYTGTDLIHTVSDWTGRTWTYAYDTTNGIDNLVSVTNPLGDVTSYGYAAGTHNLTSVIRPETGDIVGHKHVKTTFSYYQNGKTFQYADGLGDTTSMDYDLFRQQTRVTDPLGNVKEFDYDPSNGALLKLTKPDGAILDFTNNGAGLRNSKTDGLGYKTQYQYDSNGNVQQETDPAPKPEDPKPTVVTTYGPYDQVASVTDRNGVTKTTSFYTSSDTCGVAGKPKSVTIASLDGVSNVKLRDYCWNPDGTLDYVMDYLNPGGARYRVTILSYEPGTNGLNVSGKLVLASDGSQSIHTHYTYDALGRMTSKTLSRRTSESDPSTLALTTHYAYDDLDHVTKVTDPIGNIKETVYDKNGKVHQIIKHYLNSDGTTYTDRTVSTRTYDAADRLVSDKDVNGQTTSYTYDADGRRVSKTDPTGNVTRYQYDAMGRRTAVKDGDGHTTKTAYDLAGHPVSVTNPDGQTTVTHYDARGRAVSVVDPKGYERDMKYDANGNLTCIVDANAQAGLQPKDSHGCSVYKQYDEMNRLTKVVDALNHTTVYTYDLFGDRTSVEDAKHHKTTYVYNGFGRRVEVWDPLVQSPDKHTSYTYDEAGNILTKTDRRGQTTTYTYDKLNRLTKVAYADGTTDTYHYNKFGDRDSLSNDTVDYGFSYDKKHRLKNKTDTRGTTSHSLSWTYNAADKIQSKTTYGGDVTHYIYDGTHRLVALRNPDYLQVSYQYDPAGRLLSRILSNGAHTDYTYDPDGFLATLENETATGAKVDNVSYTRDRLGHILTATNSKGKTTYGYDALYRLTSADYPGTADDEAFDYDAVGNRLHYIKNGVILYHYFYDADNRLTKIEENSTGAIVQAFVYDADGNMITRCSGGTVARGADSCSGQTVVNYEWDARNRLVNVTGLPTDNSYEYDPFNYRIETSDSRGTTDDYLEGENLEARYTGAGQPAASYLRGVATDEIVNGYLYDPAGKATNITFHHDALTNVVGLSSANGKVLETTRYGAFGNELGDNINGLFPANNLKYTGRKADRDTGLYYYRARYYDPSLGRFISEDPKGFDAGMDFYVYADNDPVNVNDPSGKCGVGDCLLLAAMAYDACAAGGCEAAGEALAVAGDGIAGAWGSVFGGTAAATETTAATTTATVTTAKAVTGYTLGYGAAAATGTKSALGRVGAGLMAAGGFLGTGSALEWLGGRGAARFGATAAASGVVTAFGEGAGQFGDHTTYGTAYDLNKIMAAGAIGSFSSATLGEGLISVAGSDLSGWGGYAADTLGLAHTTVGATLGTDAIFGKSESSTGGGPVNYPSLVNTNMLQSVYAKGR